METKITDHGAIPDGLTLCTEAIAAAIDRVHAAGGGRVRVPPGTFLSGMVRLKDGVELHLERGAVLRAAPDIEAHLPLIHTSGPGDHWGKNEGSFHLVVAQRCRDVALTGPGRLDGNGTAWYTPIAEGSDWPRPDHPDGWRMGAMVLFTECQDVLVRDVQLGNVCNWTLHLHECDDARVRDIAIANPAQSPNSDGIDITGCRGVSISGCHIDTGDDAICLKTLPAGRSCENVTVSDCVLRTHCVALKLGCGESFRDMRNVVFSNCTLSGSHRAIGLYSLEGAVLENILFDNITFDTRAALMFTRPIHIDLRRKNDASKLGAIRNIRISGLVGESNGRSVFTAEAGGWLEDIVLRDVVVRIPVFDDPVPHGAEQGGGQFSNRSPWARVERAAFVFENARGVVMDNVRVRWPEDGGIEAVWRPATKLANGTHKLFVPADWTLPPGTPVHAVSARNLRGEQIDTRGLRGWNGGEAFRVEACGGQALP